MNRVSNRRMGRGMITTAILLPLLVSLLTPQIALKLRLFCAPATHLAALFLSAPVQQTADGYRINLALPIEVTTDCSAIKFFSLALAVLVGLAVERRWSHRGYLALVPLTYAITLFANASRIISTWYIDSLFAPLLHTTYQAGLHGVVGALIFMSTLVALYITLGRSSHEHGTETIAA